MISYNPGYQSVLKDLKTSTRQRFVSLAFDYPDEARKPPSSPTKPVSSATLAERLAVIGAKVRNLRNMASKRASAPGC